MGSYKFQADNQPAVAGEAKKLSITFEDSLIPRPVNVASVTVAFASNPVGAGKKIQATATAYGPDGQVLLGRGFWWSSSNELAAKVSSSGEVTGVGAGNADIAATSEGTKGKAEIKVTGAVAWDGVDHRKAQRRVSTEPYNATPDRRSQGERRIRQADAPAAQAEHRIAQRRQAPAALPAGQDERRSGVERRVSTRPTSAPSSIYATQAQGNATERDRLGASTYPGRADASTYPGWQSQG